MSLILKGTLKKKSQNINIMKPYDVYQKEFFCLYFEYDFFLE